MDVLECVCIFDVLLIQFKRVGAVCRISALADQQLTLQ